jgi:hypothetical protein
MGLDVALGETLHLLEEHGFPSSLNYSLPFSVYYLNGIGYNQLQTHMEETFGEVWDMKRVQRCSSSSSSQDLFGEERTFPLTHHDPSEIDRILSHLYTIRKAYLKGDEVAMITEDNLSPLLM